LQKNDYIDIIIFNLIMEEQNMIWFIIIIGMILVFHVIIIP